jgi:hypothetical protein
MYTINMTYDKNSAPRIINKIEETPNTNIKFNKDCIGLFDNNTITLQNMHKSINKFSIILNINLLNF